MTIEDFYKKIDGDYDDALSRLANESRIDKYIRKFAENTDYEKYLSAMEAENSEEIFRTVHTIKGMCLNMSFTNLAKSSSILCDAYRSGTPTEDVTNLKTNFQNDYKTLMSAITEYIN